MPEESSASACMPCPRCQRDARLGQGFPDRQYQAFQGPLNTRFSRFHPIFEIRFKACSTDAGAMFSQSTDSLIFLCCHHVKYSLSAITSEPWIFQRTGGQQRGPRTATAYPKIKTGDPRGCCLRCMSTTQIQVRWTTPSVPTVLQQGH